MPAGEFKKPFAVHDSGAVRKLFLDLQLRAALEGRGQEMLDAYRQIVQRLQTDPLGFGEPKYSLKHLRLQVRSCSIRPLVVDYAVTVEHQLVFIKFLRLMSA